MSKESHRDLRTSLFDVLDSASINDRPNYITMDYINGIERLQNKLISENTNWIDHFVSPLRFVRGVKPENVKNYSLKGPVLAKITNTWQDVKRAFSLLCVRTFSDNNTMLEAPPGSREDLVEAARTPCSPTDLDTVLYGYTNGIYVLDHTPDSMPDMDMLQLFASPAGRALVSGENDNRSRRGTPPSTRLRRKSSSRTSTTTIGQSSGIPTPPPRQRKSSTELYKEAVEILGLTCSLTDSCRCIECQSNYFDCDDECGDARTELAAGTPILLDHALSHPLTCSIQ